MIVYLQILRLNKGTKVAWFGECPFKWEFPLVAGDDKGKTSSSPERLDFVTDSAEIENAQSLTFFSHFLIRFAH